MRDILLHIFRNRYIFLNRLLPWFPFELQSHSSDIPWRSNRTLHSSFYLQTLSVRFSFFFPYSTLSDLFIFYHMRNPKEVLWLYHLDSAWKNGMPQNMRSYRKSLYCSKILYPNSVSVFKHIVSWKKKQGYKCISKQNSCEQPAKIGTLVLCRKLNRTINN